MEDKTTEKILENYLGQIEFLRFKEELRRETYEKEVIIRDEIYKVNLANAKIIPLLEAIKKDVEVMDTKITKVSDSSKEMVSEVSESTKEMSKVINLHTVDLAVLKEVHNSKSAVNNAETKKNPDGKLSGLNNFLEYKKSIMLGIFGLASAIGVALLNNAETILRFLGY